MKILILEDNERLCNLMATVLRKEKYQVDTYHDGDMALNSLNKGYSCLILDINVPGLDGILVMSALRLVNKKIPVIIISSNHELSTIQEAYELGCDDYLKKPFFMYELVQKVKKLCFNAKVLKIAKDFIFDCENDLLTYQNNEIFLTKKEILLFKLLSQNEKKIYTFSEIEEFVWEGENTTLVNIRALIKRLRKKLPIDCIKVVKGLGYSLDLIRDDIL